MWIDEVIPWKCFRVFSCDFFLLAYSFSRTSFFYWFQKAMKWWNYSDQPDCFYRSFWQQSVLVPASHSIKLGLSAPRTFITSHSNPANEASSLSQYSCQPQSWNILFKSFARMFCMRSMSTMDMYMSYSGKEVFRPLKPKFTTISRYCTVT